MVCLILEWLKVASTEWITEWVFGVKYSTNHI